MGKFRRTIAAITSTKRAIPMASFGSIIFIDGFSICLNQAHGGIIGEINGFTQANGNISHRF
jgi:hypothetical protein